MNNSFSQSLEIGELNTALAKAQADFKMVEYSSESTGRGGGKFKWARLEYIIDATKESLGKYNITIEQHPIASPFPGFSHAILTMLSVGSQWRWSVYPFTPTDMGEQEIGKATTYAKRIAYTSILRIAVGDPDIDDNKPTEQHSKKWTPIEPTEPISTEQLEQLEYELKDHPRIAQRVLEGLTLKSLKDMPKHKFLSSIDRIRYLKNNEEKK